MGIWGKTEEVLWRPVDHKSGNEKHIIKWSTHQCHVASPLWLQVSILGAAWILLRKGAYSWRWNFVASSTPGDWKGLKGDDLEGVAGIGIIALELLRADTGWFGRYSSCVCCFYTGFLKINIYVYFPFTSKGNYQCNINILQAIV